MEKKLVQINYKSGRAMTFWFKKFAMTTNVQGGLKTIEYAFENPENGAYIGIDHIESVFILKSEKIENVVDTPNEVQ